MLKINGDAAYILHTYAYRETSLILEVFTQNHGRLSIIAKGAKRPQSRVRGLLQPFIPILISCTGRGELLTLTGVEADVSGETPKYTHLLLGQRLISAFYVNELLMRLLQRRDSASELFDIYQHCLNGLADNNTCEQTVLRLFEKHFIKCLGYDLQLNHEVTSHDPIRANQQYLFDPEQGPSLIPEFSLSKENRKGCIVEGQSLIDLEREILSDKRSLSDAKKITRYALNLHLGLKPLETRRLLSIAE